ncbi:aquaporin [Marinivivus vitaminiproducens]|uniref:aquaporin n=1 Tax=Marinivivus vitaminiproducens TaxID=3035935 RepID=UPI0027A78F67|nr:aquaporin family protein [Geminicoccaceae bacterium SCSIO 64248]
MATASLEPPLPPFDLPRRLVAEALGTALLLAVVVGSGIMGERLAGGNVAVALLGNALATGAGLAVLITMLGPVSGAHFNPAVTLVFALRRAIAAPVAAGYVAVQMLGALLGVWAAHLMFDRPVLQVSTTLRDGPAQALSEGIATFGLVAAILASLRFKPDSTPFVVGLYITSAYWFTASTSFANPAVTVARGLSDTFAGIAPSSVPAFIAAQIAGAVAAAGLSGWLFREARPA